MRRFLTGLILVTSFGVVVVAADAEEQRVAAQFEPDQATYTIHSPTGIGKTSITKPTAGWPKTVTLRLCLKGLESFALSNGKTRLEGSVSSQDGTARVWKDGQEDKPLDVKNPYWLAVRRLDRAGKPTAGKPTTGNAAADGSFELRLPPAFLKENPATITVNWIDFFRN